MPPEHSSRPCHDLSLHLEDLIWLDFIGYLENSCSSTPIETMEILRCDVLPYLELGGKKGGS